MRDRTLPLDTYGIPIDPAAPVPGQVMAYAKTLAADPDMHALLDRMGKWGLPNADELQRLEAFRDAWLADQGFETLNLNGFFGAIMLQRRIVRGEVAGLQDPQAWRFLEEDEARNAIVRVRRADGGGIKTVPNRIDETMWLANEVKQRCPFWPLMQDDYRHAGDPHRVYPGSEAFLRYWYEEYGPKHGVINRALLPANVQDLLREEQAGRFVSIETTEAWNYLNEKPMPTSRHIKEHFDWGSP